MHACWTESLGLFVDQSELEELEAWGCDMSAVLRRDSKPPFRAAPTSPWPPASGSNTEPLQDAGGVKSMPLFGTPSEG